jgi:hypothetical protein
MIESYWTVCLRVKWRHAPIPDQPSRCVVLLDGQEIGSVRQATVGWVGVTASGRPVLSQSRRMEMVDSVLSEHLAELRYMEQAREAS